MVMPTIERDIDVRWAHVSLAWVTPKLQRQAVQYEFDLICAKFETIRVCFYRFGAFFHIGVRGPFVEHIIMPLLYRAIFRKRRKARRIVKLLHVSWNR
jgi:hypothetical protein